MTGLFIALPLLLCYGDPATPATMQEIKDNLTNWMDQAGRNPVLTKQQILEIAKRIQELEEGSPKRKKLVNKLVLHNMRLVIRFVHNFMKSKSMHKWGSVETADFLQVGIFGLYRAAEKYDPSLGYTFATYANHWIRSFVSRYNMRASSPFKMSEEMCRNAYAYERYGKIYNSSRQGRGWRDNPEMMCQLVRAAQSPASLDMEIETGRFLIDVLAEKEDKKVEFYEDSFSPEVEEAIKRAQLTAEENRIVRLAFLDGLKWPEVNAIHPVSKSEFTAVKRSALNKLKLVVDPGIMRM